LALLLLDMGDYDGAETLLRESLEMRRRLLGDNHLEVATNLSSIATLLVARGQAAEAEPLIREALSILGEILPPDHWGIAYAESVLGAVLSAYGRHEEAEPLLSKSYPIVRDKTGVKSPYTRAVLARIVDLYEAWSRPEKAAEYRELLTAAGGPP
jgi:serine/threonine-protein kinase